jgi:predicted 2-oxoglutarate/Fe(II)-dependent dioxygenase YbiX
MTENTQSHAAFALPGHIQRGDPAPWWRQGQNAFAFDPAAGRYIVLCFYGSAGDAVGQAALGLLRDTPQFVAQQKAAYFCICHDRRDRSRHGVEAQFPALQFLWDFDATMHEAYGAAARMWIVLDPMLRVIDVIPFSGDGADQRRLLDLLEALPPPGRHLGLDLGAPVLLLPNVFEPAFCDHLIAQHVAHGGRESGFMTEIGGKAVEAYDPAWKRRRDLIIGDAALIELIKARLARRVGVMLQRAFHFTMSRVERHLVACYAAEDGGHFGPHRDDTVKASEHRRFAISINLNDEFDGGEVGFPEFGAQRYKAPPGAALIFSTSLLHAVAPVTRGRRYAYLPFVHDEAAEQQRLANLQFLAQPSAAPG